MQFFNALQGIFTIMIMVLLGFVLMRRGWFGGEAINLIPKMVNVIAIPTYMVWNLMTTFDHDSFGLLVKAAIVPTVSMLLCYAIAYVVAEVMKLPRSKKGIFRSAFFSSSAIFVGIPINLALFGESSIPYVLVYFLPNAFLFWTIGNYSISLAGKDGVSAKIMSMETVHKVFSPPLISFIVAIIFILLNLKLPIFVMNTLKYLGGLMTPLSMLFVGMAMSSVEFKKFRFTKDIVAVLIGRFVVAPALVYFLSFYIEMPDLMRKVFIIQAALPAMTQTSLMAKVYGADAEYGALLVSITTIAAMITIPLYMIIL